MIKLRITLTFSIILTICFMGKSAAGQRCGTIVDNSWTKLVNEDSLLGNWTIYYMSYSKNNSGSPADVWKDLNEILTLKPDGTGSISNTKITWNLENDSIRQDPILTLTPTDSMITPPLNLMFHGTAEIHLSSVPTKNKKYRWGGRAGKNGTTVYIAFGILEN